MNNSFNPKTAPHPTLTCADWLKRSKKKNQKGKKSQSLTVSRAPYSILSCLILFQTGLGSITLWAQWPVRPASRTEESWGPAGIPTPQLEPTWPEPNLFLPALFSTPVVTARGRVCVAMGWCCVSDCVCWGNLDSGEGKRMTSRLTTVFFFVCLFHAVCVLTVVFPARF